MSVSTTVKAIQDIMRKDAGVDGDAQRINQLVWMFFLKIFDDRESEKEILEDNYRSPIPEELRWRNWAANAEGITGETLADFVNNLFKTLKGLTSPDPRAQLVRHVFEEANNYMKSGTLMRQVINKINEIDFNRKNDLHLFGDIYEQILRDLQSAGNAGEFYTPRAVTKFMVQMVDPQLGERVLDPACGTGGFLTNTIEHVRHNYVHSIEDEQILQNSIKGVEKKQLPYFLSVTNLMLHGIDTPNQISHDNTLARPYRDYQPEDRVDVIVTNPPFGGMEEDGIEKNFPKTYSTRETADLFLVLITHLLREGGRGAIVLPDGTLFGEGIKTRIKEKLLTECNLHTIVRLPNGVFNPYTGIKTNLLFFTKGQKTKEVWYYEHSYPQGVKSYNKTKPIRIEEFELEKDWWTNRVESERAWRVSFDDIAANNFNLDIKNPNAPDEDHGDFEELLAEHELVTRGLAETRDTLKNELMKALQATVRGQSLQTFFDNLGLLADTPNSVAKLRELILQLAVQGKLVQQSANDEPAFKLLERARHEKNRLIEEGRLKKSKEVLAPTIDKPFPLPPSWRWTTFDEIRTYAFTGLERSQQQQSAKNEFAYFKMNNITSDGRCDLTFVARINASSEELSKFELSDGDFLFNTRNSYELVGKTCVFSSIVREEFLFNNNILKVKFAASINPYFINLWFVSPYGKTILDILKSSTTNVAAIYQGKLASFPLPLPPLEEQKHIVAKVNQLMALCDELEAKLRQTEADYARLMKAAVRHVLETVGKTEVQEALSSTV